MSTILITGAASGLGAALFDLLPKQNHGVVGLDIVWGQDVRTPQFDDGHRALFDHHGLDVLINCAAVNKIDWLERVAEADWDEVMDVNAKGIFKMTQCCLPWLVQSRGTVLNIVSNAAHMPMTCSLAYNASKGAAHIMTLQLARELTRKHGITVFGIAPNKMAGTGMSKSIDEQVVRTRGWTQEYAQHYQLAGLLTGQETPVESVAEFIGFLLQDKAHHECLTGCVLPYGA